MTRRTPTLAAVAITLMCSLANTNSAVTGYYYEHPIRPFNPPPFSTLPSTGPYSSIAYGSKVATSPRPRLTVPPIPSLPPLTSLTTAPPSTRLRPIPYTYPRPQPAQSTYIRQNQNQVQFQFPQLQQGIVQQQPSGLSAYQQQQERLRQLQKQLTLPSYPQTLAKSQYTYNQPPRPTPNSIQPKLNPLLASPSPTTKFALRPPPLPTLTRSTPRSITRLTPKPVVSLRSPASTYTPPKVNIPTRPIPNRVPTTVASPILSNSNPTQAGIAQHDILSSPDVYVIDGRALKQYQVYEEIDNDIDQQVENFIPPNFFQNSYHSKISSTHPLGEDIQLENRISGQQRFLPINQQRQNIQQQQPLNSIAIGSGGLGFVRLPNGNVYLGSGSLGYISSLQRNQDVEHARTRTGAPTPDALHFGHGPLSDSLYLQG